MEDPKISEKGFNGTIFQCIDTALSTIGETSKLALYHQIALKNGLSVNELQSRPPKVLQGLEEILGETGYAFIEKLIIREIKDRFGLSVAVGVCLSKVVADAREKFFSS